MNQRVWIASIVPLIVMLACNLPFGRSTAEPTPTQPIAATSPSTAPTTPTSTPFIPTTGIFATITPVFPIASPKDKPVNCRYGPGVTFAVISVLNIGQQAEITGKSADGLWWQVKNPSDPSTYCWLAFSVTDASGNLDSLPVVDPPVVTVSRIKVTVDAPVLNVSCDALPQTIHAKAEITTNGPTTIAWRWETSAGETSSQEYAIYEEADTKITEYYFRVGSANDYWVQLHVFAPNDTTGRTDFKVNCGP